MLIKSKMNANFDSDLSPSTVTKKFWSFVKSSSKSCRIPEKMHLGEYIRRKSKDIADLFNKHFYDQFSEESLYDIDINFNNDNFFDFTISTNCIYQQLSRLNSNKSMGPEISVGGYLKNVQSRLHTLCIHYYIYRLNRFSSSGLETRAHTYT